MTDDLDRLLAGASPAPAARPRYDLEAGLRYVADKQAARRAATAGPDLPGPDEDGPMIPPCLPRLPRPAPALLPPQGMPARHRRSRLEDPVPEGVLSLHEARNRKRYREYVRGRFGDG